MKIYVMIFEDSWGSSVHSVYSTEEKAKEARQELNLPALQAKAQPSYDYTEFELDEKLEGFRYH